MSAPSLILASQSKSRQSMLRGAGLIFTCAPAHLHEDAITQEVLARGGKAQDVAQTLARAKALHIARENPNTLVIGSDQVLVHRDALLNKALDKKDAAEKIKKLSGDEHKLISAVAVARGHEVLWTHADEATLKMRDISTSEIDAYIQKAGDILTTSVGAYALEGVGAWLFERVQGDYFTVLGMPLLPLLSFLQTQGIRL